MMYMFLLKLHKFPKGKPSQLAKYIYSTIPAKQTQPKLKTKGNGGIED